MTGHASTSRVRYRTIVADPPWPIGPLTTTRLPAGVEHDGRPRSSPYSFMPVEKIKAIHVPADANAHLYLWTTQKFLPCAFDVAKAWGFRYSSTLIWAKTPMGIGLGGTFAPNAEFILFCRRGSLRSQRRTDTCWWNWPRTGVHSKKPEAFMDLVESASPGPYLELFARRQRLGWDTWGDEALEHVDLVARDG